MNYLHITHCDQVNGEGLRTVLWVAGCSHDCHNCQNPFSHDCHAGIQFDDNAKQELFRDLNEDWCSGITFSGGDPLFEKNRQTIIDLCKEIKDKFPTKTIWLYTGYTFNEIVDSISMINILKYIDVIIDGEFIESLKDPNLRWRGSSNQNVIYVKRKINRLTECLNNSDHDQIG